MEELNILIKHRRRLKREIVKNSTPGRSSLDAFMLEDRVYCVLNGTALTMEVKVYGSTRDEVMTHLDKLVAVTAERIINPVVISPRYGQATILGIRGIQQRVR